MLSCYLYSSSPMLPNRCAPASSLPLRNDGSAIWEERHGQGSADGACLQQYGGRCRAGDSDGSLITGGAGYAEIFGGVTGGCVAPSVRAASSASWTTCRSSGPCTTRRRTPAPSGRCLEKYADNVAAASWDSVIFDLPGRESLQRVPTIDPLRGSKAHVGALLDECDTALELVLPAHGPLTAARPGSWPASRSASARNRRPAARRRACAAIPPRRRVGPAAPRPPAGSA